MSFIDIAKTQLRIDEGVRSKPYKDTVGKLTIGVGRNLDDVGLHSSEIDLMLDNDVKTAAMVAAALFSNFNELSENRKAVLVNMAFNLGRSRLAEFIHFRGAVEQEHWSDAKKQMLDSLWARQVGARAQRLADQMEKG